MKSKNIWLPLLSMILVLGISAASCTQADESINGTWFTDDGFWINFSDEYLSGGRIINGQTEIEDWSFNYNIESDYDGDGYKIKIFKKTNSYSFKWFSITGNTLIFSGGSAFTKKNKSVTINKIEDKSENSLNGTWFNDHGWGVRFYDGKIYKDYFDEILLSVGYEYSTKNNELWETVVSPYLYSYYSIENNTLKLSKHENIFTKLSFNSNDERIIASRPKEGYDKVRWGAPLYEVYREYVNHYDYEFISPYNNDPNIAAIREKNVSGNMTQRLFLFNKWNAPYFQLYRVWVHYKKEKDTNSTGQALMDLLSQKYGQVSKTITEPAKRKGMNLGALGDFASTSTLTRYVWEYSPELTIELQNTFKFDNGISLGMVYIEEKEYENSVVYTWTKYRDAYQATKNPKIQL